MEKGPSPMKTEVLEVWLCAYPCKEDASYLWDDFRYGFRVRVRVRWWVGACYFWHKT